MTCVRDTVSLLFASFKLVTYQNTPRDKNDCTLTSVTTITQWCSNLQNPQKKIINYKSKIQRKSPYGLTSVIA